ncbi:MAG TPA: hypothetical protein VN888_02675 [Mycobacterium sp.]|nr:hypothetical protein [Mycobacterium sp.]
MSRPDRAQVGVDFAPPRRPNRARQPLLALALVALALGAMTVAVTQLLLH